MALERRLSPNEARVLGCLLEKQVLTPDAYPLTLNYLVGACNQKTSREPVLELADEEVAHALVGLRRLGLAVEMKTAESRVLKYSHSLTKAGSFSMREQAMLCLLLLRGPQTSGELKSRSERLADFDSLAAVEAALEALAGRVDGGLVLHLPRRPGEKEARWVQLLTGEPEAGVRAGAPAGPSEGGGPSLTERVEKLEAELQRLKAIIEKSPQA